MEVDYSRQPGLIPGQPTDDYQQQHGLIPVFGAVEAPKHDESYSPSASERRILGLRITTFWLLLALIVVIIAAAVGGGVGSSMAVNNAKTACLNSAAALSQTPSSSSTVASTTKPGISSTKPSSALPTGTTVWGPLATSLPYTGCPDNNGTTYTSKYLKSAYKIYCDLDIPFTSDSDILYLITPTFQLCIEACSSWNDAGTKTGKAGKACTGVSFVPNRINGDTNGDPSECVLKSTTGIEGVLFKNQGFTVDSAALLQTV